MANKQSKAQREQMLKSASHDRFLKQQENMIKPNLCYLGVVLMTFLLYLILDGPAKMFDASSILFTLLLLTICAVPLINLIVVKFARKTLHLLVTQSLHQLTIVPLIYVYLFKYEQLKEASASHLVIIYFIYVIIFLVFTSVNFRLKSKFLTSNDEL